MSRIASRMAQRVRTEQKALGKVAADEACSEETKDAAREVWTALFPRGKKLPRHLYAFYCAHYEAFSGDVDATAKFLNRPSKYVYKQKEKLIEHAKNILIRDDYALRCITGFFHYVVFQDSKTAKPQVFEDLFDYYKPRIVKMANEVADLSNDVFLDVLLTLTAAAYTCVLVPFLGVWHLRRLLHMADRLLDAGQLPQGSCFRSTIATLGNAFAKARDVTASSFMANASVTDTKTVRLMCDFADECRLYLIYLRDCEHSSREPSGEIQDQLANRAAEVFFKVTGLPLEKPPSEEEGRE